jgi:hypothetical protein
MMEIKRLLKNKNYTCVWKMTLEPKGAKSKMMEIKRASKN